MANIFAKDPVYISLQDVKDSTSKPSLAALVDSDPDDVKELIYKAQLAIDAYINPYPKYSAYGDTRLFPISVDNESVMPDDIKIATLYMVEQLYVNGDTITGETRTVKSEKT